MNKYGLIYLLSCCCIIGTAESLPQPCYDPTFFSDTQASQLRISLAKNLEIEKIFLTDFSSRIGNTFNPTPLAQKCIIKRIEMANRLIENLSRALKSTDRDDVFFAARSLRSLKLLREYLNEEEKLCLILNGTSTTKVFSIRDFGAHGNGITDDSDAFHAVLAAAAKCNGTPVTIRLPHGIYLLNKGYQGPEVNNSQAEKIRAPLSHIVISGLRNVTIEGESPDTSLRFGIPEINGITLVGCSNVTLRNLTLASQITPFFEMEIETVDINRQTLMGRPIPGVLAIDSPIMQKKGKQKRASLVFNSNGTLVTGSLFYTGEYTLISPQKIKVFIAAGPLTSLAPGMRLVIPARGDGHALLIYSSSLCTAEKVTINNSWGMGFANLCSNATTLSQCRIVPAPGVNFSTNADGSHSPNCDIGPALVDCDFRAMGDDPFNCYNRGCYIYSAEGNKILSNANVAAEKMLTFYSSTTGQILAELHSAEPSQHGIPWHNTTTNRTVLSEKLPKALCTYETLGKKLPSASEEMGVFTNANTQSQPDLIFNTIYSGAWALLSGCHFSDNRNCGPVIQCDNTLLENCSIENMESHAVKIGGFTTWREGPPPINVLMRNCKVRNSGRIRTEFFVGGNHTTAMSPGRHVRNAAFENNEIIANRAPAFSIDCATGITISDNQIVNSQNKVLEIGNAGNLVICNNKLNGKNWVPECANTPQVSPETEMVWPIQFHLPGAASAAVAYDGDWKTDGNIWRNSGHGFETLLSTQYSALKELKLSVRFRFLNNSGKAGLRLVEHVGAPDNGYYFLLDGQTKTFTVESRKRNAKGEWQQKILFSKPLPETAENTITITSHGTVATAEVNGQELWRGGVPLPVFYRSGFVAFNAQTAITSLAIAAGGKPNAVIAFGDSITHHCRWQEALAKRLKIEISNGGMASDDTNRARKRLESDILALHPQLVLLLLGTNNASSQQAIEDIDFIVQKLQERKIAVIICTLLPRNPRPERAIELNQRLRELCSRKNILLHDWYAVLNDGSGKMKLEYGDGVHPNPAGVELLAQSFIDSSALVLRFTQFQH